MVSLDLVLPSMAMLPVAAGATSPVGGASRRQGRPAIASPSLAPRPRRCLEDVAAVPHVRLPGAALVVPSSRAGSPHHVLPVAVMPTSMLLLVLFTIISVVLPLLLSGLGPSIGPAASLSADPSAGHILLVIYQRSRLLKDERLGSMRGPWTKMRLPLFPITPLSAMLLFTFSQMGSAVIRFMLKFLESPRRCFPVQVRNHDCQEWIHSKAALVIQISRL